MDSFEAMQAAALVLVALTLTACGGSSEVEVATANLTSTTKTQASCGRLGLPDCPLQSWMKSTMQAYQRASDYDRLSRAFGELARHAPTGYADWQVQAQRGAELAEKRDDAALKQACKNCHDAHRARYRKERRGEPLW
jgi:hypothetical protein